MSESVAVSARNVVVPAQKTATYTLMAVSQCAICGARLGRFPASDDDSSVYPMLVLKHNEKCPLCSRTGNLRLSGAVSYSQSKDGTSNGEMPPTLPRLSIMAKGGPSLDPHDDVSPTNSDRPTCIADAPIGMIGVHSRPTTTQDFLLPDQSPFFPFCVCVCVCVTPSDDVMRMFQVSKYKYMFSRNAEVEYGGTKFDKLDTSDGSPVLSHTHIYTHGGSG
jgi:hypothetical protein